MTMSNMFFVDEAISKELPMVMQALLGRFKFNFSLNSGLISHA